jgi:hypothetical protein
MAGRCREQIGHAWYRIQRPLLRLLFQQNGKHQTDRSQLVKRTPITGAAAALAVVLSGCGSDTKTEPSTSTSASKTSASTSAEAAPSTKPVPDGWETAGADTPDWAYGAIVYTGPEGAEYTLSIVALVSKLTGNVDPQKARSSPRRRS